MSLEHNVAASSSAQDGSSSTALQTVTLNVGGRTLRARKPAPPPPPPRKSAKAKGKQKAVEPEAEVVAWPMEGTVAPARPPTRWFTHASPTDAWSANSSRPARRSGAASRPAGKASEASSSKSAAPRVDAAEPKPSKATQERAAPTRRSSRLKQAAAAFTAEVSVPIGRSLSRVVAASQRLTLRIPGRPRASSSGRPPSATVVESDSTTVVRSSSEDSAIGGPSQKALGKRKARDLDDIEEEREPAREGSPREAKRTRMDPDAELLLGFSAQETDAATPGSALPFDCGETLA